MQTGPEKVSETVIVSSISVVGPPKVTLFAELLNAVVPDGTFVSVAVAVFVPFESELSVIVYGLVLLVPGDAATKLAGGEDASPQQIEAVREELGLDRPFVTQYVDWLEGAVTLDLGESLYSHQPVASEIWDRVPVTLQIAGGALVFGLLVGIPLGIISGMRPRGIGDRGVVFEPSHVRELATV